MLYGEYDFYPPLYKIVKRVFSFNLYSPHGKTCSPLEIRQPSPEFSFKVGK